MQSRFEVKMDKNTVFSKIIVLLYLTYFSFFCFVLYYYSIFILQLKSSHLNFSIFLDFFFFQIFLKTEKKKLKGPKERSRLIFWFRYRKVFPKKEIVSESTPFALYKIHFSFSGNLSILNTYVY